MSNIFNFEFGLQEVVYMVNWYIAVVIKEKETL